MYRSKILTAAITVRLPVSHAAVLLAALVLGWPLPAPAAENPLSLREALAIAVRDSAYTKMLTVQVSIYLPLLADRHQNREAAARLAQVKQARAARGRPLLESIYTKPA